VLDGGAGIALACSSPSAWVPRPVCPPRAVPVNRDLLLGRGDDCDVVPPSNLASRRHAHVWPSGGGVAVEALGSRNGTRVNARRVPSVVQLQDGDTLTMGDSELQVRLGDAVAPRPPVTADRKRGSTDGAGTTPALAVLESLVGTAFSQAIGTDLAGTYALAAITPLLGTVIALRRDGTMRVSAVVVVTAIAVADTVVGVTSRRRIAPGQGRASLRVRAAYSRTGWMRERQRPPGVHPRHRRRGRPIAQDVPGAEEEGRNTRCSLHPAHARWQQRLRVAVLDEPPVGVGTRSHRALQQRVGEVQGEVEVIPFARALPRVEEGLAQSRRAAASPVVVPEAGVQARGQTGGADAVQASAVPRQRRRVGDVLDACVVESEEEQRGAGAALAPGVRELVLVVGVGGEVPGDAETLAAAIAQRDQVLGTPAARGGQVGTVQLGAGQRQGCRDAREAVRELGIWV
jgi:hypothetical protein